MKYTLLLLLATMVFATPLSAESPSEKYAPMTIPRGYVCYRVADEIRIDGLADEKSWIEAPSTDTFVDISGFDHPEPRYRTTAKMLWDDEYLYIFAQMEEPHVRADLTLRDTVVFYDNDFEVFIDPRGDGQNYFEIETNATGVIFDLSLTAPYRTPRRPFVQFQWNSPGLKLATHIDGTINDPRDTDKGWSVEMAIPRRAIASELDNFLKAGSYLRVDFSRVEWQFETDGARYTTKRDANGKLLPEDNWVWSPTGQIAMHMPERWGYLYLSEKKSGHGSETFRYPADETVRRFLWMLFYAQEEHYAETHTFYKNIADFSLSATDLMLLPPGYEIRIETTSHTYEITASCPDGRTFVIDESGSCFERE